MIVRVSDRTRALSSVVGTLVFVGLAIALIAWQPSTPPRLVQTPTAPFQFVAGRFPDPIAVWNEHEKTLTVTVHFPGDALLCLTPDDCRRPEDWRAAARRSLAVLEAAK